MLINFELDERNAWVLTEALSLTIDNAVNFRYKDESGNVAYDGELKQEMEILYQDLLQLRGFND